MEQLGIGNKGTCALVGIDWITVNCSVLLKGILLISSDCRHLARVQAVVTFDHHLQVASAVVAVCTSSVFRTRDAVSSECGLELERNSSNMLYIRPPRTIVMTET
jgi:hypothetical protein